MTDQSLDSAFAQRHSCRVFRLLFLLLCPLTLAASPRIAVVDMDKIYQGYQRKIEIERQISERLEALKNSPRTQAVQEMDQKMQDLARIVRDKASPIKTREKAANEFNTLAIEHQALIKNVNEHLRKDKLDATEELVETVERLIGEVHKEIVLIGKEKGFDLVLETAGSTSSQTSPLIYIREKTDITQLVLTRLNQSTAPASEN